MMERTVKLCILGVMLTLLLIESAVGQGEKDCNYQGLYCVYRFVFPFANYILQCTELAKICVSKRSLTQNTTEKFNLRQ